MKKINYGRVKEIELNFISRKNKRNNINSISNNNYYFTNTSNNINKSSNRREWTNRKS